VSHQPIAKAIDKIFENSLITDTAQRYQKVAEQIVVDVLKWMKKTQQYLETQSPYEDEINLLGPWEATPMFWFAKQWYHGNIRQKQVSRERYTKYRF
jgi:hypothetical protein